MPPAAAPAVPLADERLCCGRSAMKRAFVLSLATIMAGMAAPAAAYYWTKPSSDPLDDTLRAYNFRRINPPSNLMTVGALYYVDSSGGPIGLGRSGDRVSHLGAARTGRA